ncbi:MAG TPA: hypothetical protein VHX65_11795, partial [Pirellulales bacterium]|nr:hypothetical protein [Pirellulales bacterium]
MTRSLFALLAALALTGIGCTVADHNRSCCNSCTTPSSNGACGSGACNCGNGNSAVAANGMPAPTDPAAGDPAAYGAGPNG